jgi:hypothetical protein
MGFGALIMAMVSVISVVISRGRLLPSLQDKSVQDKPAINIITSTMVLDFKRTRRIAKLFKGYKITDKEDSVSITLPTVCQQHPYRLQSVISGPFTRLMLKPLKLWKAFVLKVELQRAAIFNPLAIPATPFISM